ncbi:hypothetical protein Tco_1003443 [Tanacetum coccineum]|uniref:Uncharacterized protein n=1 Tax=Tanacetum coccineum TaxID=301880 RepID=A0ABQ5FAG2_9ASTR
MDPHWNTQQQKTQTSQDHHQCALQKSNAWGTDTVSIIGRRAILPMSASNCPALLTNGKGRQILDHLIYCINNASKDCAPEVKSQLKPGTDFVDWLHGEKIMSPWGKYEYRLWLQYGALHNCLDNFMVNQITKSPYNGIIGRPGISRIRAPHRSKECNTAHVYVTRLETARNQSRDKLEVSAIIPEYPKETRRSPTAVNGQNERVAADLRDDSLTLRKQFHKTLSTNRVPIQRQAYKSLPLFKNTQSIEPIEKGDYRRTTEAYKLSLSSSSINRALPLYSRTPTREEFVFNDLSAKCLGQLAPC